ncbi:hypothetical protein Y032_0065g3656 [Ancylostoma ceylanicum]|nr:hypothetical protein Y032_0065g3656 [Ancylostoma ceylanicum]
MSVAKTAGSNGIYVNEDIAHIIVKHIRKFDGTVESEWIFRSLERHWTNIKRVSKAFYTAVCRCLARTSRVGVILAENGTVVTLYCDDSRDDNGCIAQTFFVTINPLKAYIRMVARLVSNPVVLDLEDYYGHTVEGDNEVIRALTCFRDIKIINVYRECRCPACLALVQHAGPSVPVVEWGPTFFDQRLERSYDSDTSVIVDSDDEDAFFDPV